MESNPFILQFEANGQHYRFDTSGYQSNLGITRSELPQIGVFELLKNDMYKKLIEAYKVGIVHTKLPVKMLKPTQVDIDYTRVQIDIAKYGFDDEFERPLLVSNDLRIIDGHHQHVRWMITNPERITEVLMVDMAIFELISWLKDTVIPYFNITRSIPENFQLDEDFGNQGPEAVPGMGSVELPSVAQSSELAPRDGSGDLPGVIHGPLKFQDKEEEDKKKVEEAIEIMSMTMVDTILQDHNRLIDLVENAVSNVYPGSRDNSGKELIKQIKMAANSFLTKLGYSYDVNGNIVPLNIVESITESMGDISSEHKYYPEFGGYFTEEEVKSGKALKAYKSTRGQGKFFTKDQLLAISKKYQEENGDDWLDKIREQQKAERRLWKAERIEELTSGKKLENKYGMLSIGDAIVNLASVIFSVHQINIVDSIIQFVHREIEETKDFVNSPLDEALTKAKMNNTDQKPLDVHFTKESVLQMDDLLTCMNKPVKRQFKVIDTEFSCQTLEGITIGKAGDCLVVGVDGEVYPCDKEIFDATYVPMDAAKIEESLTVLSGYFTK